MYHFKKARNILCWTQGVCSGFKTNYLVILRSIVHAKTILNIVYKGKHFLHYSLVLYSYKHFVKKVLSIRYCLHLPTIVFLVFVSFILFSTFDFLCTSISLLVLGRRFRSSSDGIQPSPVASFLNYDIIQSMGQQQSTNR